MQTKEWLMGRRSLLTETLQDNYETGSITDTYAGKQLGTNRHRIKAIRTGVAKKLHHEEIEKYLKILKL